MSSIGLVTFSAGPNTFINVFNDLLARHGFALPPYSSAKPISASVPFGFRLPRALSTSSFLAPGASRPSEPYGSATSAASAQVTRLRNAAALKGAGRHDDI